MTHREAGMTKTAEKLKAHPAADAFPMMDATRLAELRADIQANGQREPVTICDGMTIFGAVIGSPCDSFVRAGLRGLR